MRRDSRTFVLNVTAAGDQWKLHCIDRVAPVSAPPLPALTGFIFTRLPAREVRSLLSTTFVIGSCDTGLGGGAGFQQRQPSTFRALMELHRARNAGRAACQCSSALLWVMLTPSSQLWPKPAAPTSRDSNSTSGKIRNKNWAEMGKTAQPQKGYRDLLHKRFKRI